MHLRIRLLFALLLGLAQFSIAQIEGLPATFHVLDEEPGSWPRIFGAAGFQPLSTAGGKATIYVMRAGAAAPATDWLERVEAGAFLVLEGESDTAKNFGFEPSSKRVLIRSVEDLRRPKLTIVWERALEMPVFRLPESARVFARERWGKAPLMAGFQRGAGGVLWVAAPPGEQGYERFPYLLHALADLGLEPPLVSRHLWAFFDSSYRLRVDLEYFAKRWRAAGFAALHVAAWHFYDHDPQKEAYLHELIRSCHRNGVLVYAWLELPHVSEGFWNRHPEWREKTAVLQDAHLDWRKLMNFANRDCFEAAAQGVKELIEKYDWDGVNLAELYFESLEGAANPARFTPMNNEIRQEFRKTTGFDPLELFKHGAERQTGNSPGLFAFLNYRADLTARIQREWMRELEAIRRGRPHLDLVLTHVDDRFDEGMRNAIGADAAAVLPMLQEYDFTFLIEDPATVWHLGPQRYQEISRRYQPLTQRLDRLGIDINIVERYQDVYPTKQQTGTELLQIVHLASSAFPRVALYFENSILAPDLPFLPAAAAVATRMERVAERLVLETPKSAGIRWRGPALVNGRPWPVRDNTHLWLPPGTHVVDAPASGESEASRTSPRLLDFNGDLKTAEGSENSIEFSYVSTSRAIATVDRCPARIEINGEKENPLVIENDNRWVVMLPRGQHLVLIETK